MAQQKADHNTVKIIKYCLGKEMGWVGYRKTTLGALNYGVSTSEHKGGVNLQLKTKLYGKHRVCTLVQSNKIGTKYTV